MGAHAVLGVIILAFLGTNGFLWFWLQSRTVPKVERIKINQSEMNDLAAARLAEAEYLRQALRDERADHQQCMEALEAERTKK